MRRAERTDAGLRQHGAGDRGGRRRAPGVGAEHGANVIRVALDVARRARGIFHAAVPGFAFSRTTHAVGPAAAGAAGAIVRPSTGSANAATRRSHRERRIAPTVPCAPADKGRTAVARRGYVPPSPMGSRTRSAGRGTGGPRTPPDRGHRRPATARWRAVRARRPGGPPSATPPPVPRRGPTSP